MNQFPSRAVAKFGNELSLSDSDCALAGLAVTGSAWLLDTPEASHEVIISGIRINPEFLPKPVTEPLGSNWDSMSVSVTQPSIDADSVAPICEIFMRASATPSLFARIAQDPTSPGQYLAVAGDRKNSSLTVRAKTTLDPTNVLDVVRSGFEMRRWHSMALTEPVTPTQGIIDTVLELRSEPTYRAEITSDMLTGAYVSGENVISTLLARRERARHGNDPIHHYNLQTVTHASFSNADGAVIADVTRTLTYRTNVQYHNSKENVVSSNAHLAVVFEPTPVDQKSANRTEPGVDYTQLYNQARAGTKITALTEVQEALGALAASYSPL